LSDYKRFVSYIYEYIDGEKRESTGFVKINARGGECRIWVHMKGFYLHGQKPYRAYVCSGGKGTLQGFPLGVLENRNGALEWNGATKTESLMESGLPLEESSGLYIEGAGRIFAAEWDDYPVEVKAFVPAEVSEHVEPEPEVEEIEPIPMPELEKVPQTDTRKEQWGYLCRHFPVIQYTDAEGMVYAVRLSSRDLSKIPRDKWGLGNNSFLFHGFYQYQHLLLMRRQQEEQVWYHVGVPGVFNEKEQMMANLFGFEEFKVLNGLQKAEDGFGYWCRRLE